MQMDGWKDHLHITLLGEHVLFPTLHLDSLWHFVIACFLTSFLCLSERALTYAITKDWSPFSWTRRSRLKKAVWKTALYWLVTFDRLLYMLVAMTFSIGLIFVTVTALSFGQFVIEFAEARDSDRRCSDPENLKEPLLSASPTTYEPSLALHSYPNYRQGTPQSYTFSDRSSLPSRRSSPQFHRTPSPVAEVNEVVEAKPQRVATRPRSKSKPSKIFIHPADSNLARADAVALRLGLGGDTDLVKGNQYPADAEPAWTVGKGKDIARELLLGRRNTMD